MSNEITRYELAYGILMWELLRILQTQQENNQVITSITIIAAMTKAAGELS